MIVTQLVYSSQPFGFDASTLSNILLDARGNNMRDDITGALICRADLYVQMLEGPEIKVLAAYDRIRRDDRHANLVQHFAEERSERLFARWDMLDDPARSWMWTQDEVADGAVARATTDEIRGVFQRVSSEAHDELK